jgi:TusA-related sulfurtransferase
MAPTESDTPLPSADGVLEMYTDNTGGLPVCATLTPMIKSRLREMESGQILEVRVDDPSARLDVPSWSRMSGNELVAMVEEDARHTRFYLRKKMG